MRSKSNDGNGHAHAWITTVPLIAALLAPLSTLLDIPALGQRWYTFNGKEVSDPKACIALSAIGLFLNVAANILLIFRFSVRTRKYWTVFTRISTIGWIGKTIIAVINLSLYGGSTRNSPEYSYTEGFWSAIASVTIAGLISFILTLHYVWAFGKNQEDDLQSKDVLVRIAGKHFLISISFLFFVIGIQALVYSRIEHWAYFDGIYYSIVTMLTVGFGDLYPTTVPGKILLLPFAVLTISQLANEVSIIIAFFSNRADARRAKWRNKYETAIKEEAMRQNPHGFLQDEIDLIDQIARREELVTQLWDLTWSLTSLTIFWVAGAAVFQALEPWSFWESLYFEIEFCLTIGYGDSTPESPGGKVFFVVYSILAVPLIASFVVQTVTGLLSTFSHNRTRKEEANRTKLRQNGAFTAHRDFVLQHRKTFLKLLKGEPVAEVEKEEEEELNEPEASGSDSQDRVDSVREKEDPTIEEKTMLDAEEELAGELAPMPHEEVSLRVLEFALQLEAISRRLLIDNLPRDSMSRTLLIADREVQKRDVASIGGDISKISGLWKSEWHAQMNRVGDTEAGGVSTNDTSTSDDMPLEHIRRYRETFAALLVAGAKLQRLEGNDEYVFERTRGPPGEDTRDVAEIRQEAAKEAERRRHDKMPRMNTIQRTLERHRLLHKLRRKWTED